MRAPLVVSLLLSLVACTQAPAMVEYRGERYYGRATLPPAQTPIIRHASVLPPVVIPAETASTEKRRAPAQNLSLAQSKILDPKLLPPSAAEANALPAEDNEQEYSSPARTQTPLVARNEPRPSPFYVPVAKITKSPFVAPAEAPATMASPFVRPI